MYKKIALSLFFAVATLHTIFWLANMATAAPLDVCPSGCTYATIQSAVDNAVPFDNINVSAGTYSENVVISKSLTIQGADASSTIVDGTDTDSVFTIEGSVAVTLTNMTITNGNSSNTVPIIEGGGIYVERGDVTLDSVVVSNNFASNGGGIATSGGKLTILNSRIMNNIAANSTLASGGGINVSQFNTSAQALIINTTIVGNIAYGMGVGSATGGGIASSVDSLVIENSTVSDNSSSSDSYFGSAGGIFINGASGSITKTATIRNSTISGNNSKYIGAAMYVGNSAEVTMTNSTVVSNTSVSLAGGIASFDDSIVNLRSVLIALNSPQDCVEGLGFFQSHDHNLDSDDSCGLTEANDLPATSPLIGSLQDNGGSTETHALLENSPAINAGSNAACPAQDQRGVTRPQGPTCDIGAYEFEEASFFTEFIYLPMIVKE